MRVIDFKITDNQVNVVIETGIKNIKTSEFCSYNVNPTDNWEWLNVKTLKKADSDIVKQLNEVKKLLKYYTPPNKFI